MDEKISLVEKTPSDVLPRTQEISDVSHCEECDCEKFERGGPVGTVCANQDCGHSWQSHVR